MQQPLGPSTVPDTTALQPAHKDPPATRKLTPGERRYVEAFAVNGLDQGKAYSIAYGCKIESARRGATRIHHMPHVQAAIQAATRQRLTDLAPRAVDTMGSLLTAGSERVQLEAAKGVLDRNGMAPTPSPSSGAQGLSVTINIAAPDTPHIAIAAEQGES